MTIFSGRSGRIVLILRAMCVFCGSCWAYSSAQGMVTVHLTDQTRAARKVSALVCLPPVGTTDLLLFGHGGGLYAQDYQYLCTLNNATKSPLSVALLVSSCVLLVGFEGGK